MLVGELHDPVDVFFPGCIVYILDDLLLIRWKSKSMYVYNVDGEKVSLEKLGLSLNKNQGVTVSVKKQGGWKQSWQLAKQAARWST